MDPRIEDMPNGTTEATEATGIHEPEAPSRPPRNKRLATLETKLYDLYIAPAGVLMPLATAREDLRMMAAVQNYANMCPAAADQWVTLAEGNPNVLRMLESAVDGGVIGTLVVTHVLMILPFLPEHVIARMMPFRMSANGNGSTHS